MVMQQPVNRFVGGVVYRPYAEFDKASRRYGNDVRYLRSGIGTVRNALICSVQRPTSRVNVTPLTEYVGLSVMADVL
jgi:hypothetical protein